MGTKKIEVKREIMFKNLIYYNEHISPGFEDYENAKTIKNMKRGGFFPVNNLTSLKKLIEKLKKMNVDCSFGLITSGTYADKAIPICSTLVNYIIIYCFHIENNLHLKNKYPKVKKVYNIFSNVIEDISQHWLYSNNNLISNKFITFDEYSNKYINLHKKLSEFFDQNYYNLVYNWKYKNEFITFIEEKNPYDSNNIIYFVNRVEEGSVSEFIIAYTGETKLCYSLNKWLRDCNSSDYERIKYFAGPFSYALYKYAYNNKNQGIYHNKTFYRKMTIKLSDYYLYKISIGELICYPAFTSTSEKDISKYDFPTSTAIDVNKIDQNDISVVLIIKYYYYKNNNNHNHSFFSKIFNLFKNDNYYVTPCISVSEHSVNSGEEEYIFPPFSFFKIEEIEERSGTPDNPHIIHMCVPRKKNLLEFGLKQKKSIYYDKNKNELYYC